MSTEGTISKRAMSSSSDRKSLDDAMEYVVKGWLPISPIIIDLVREKLKSGEYEAHREDLIEDLRKDFSLFTWFLSKLEELHTPVMAAKTLNIDELVRLIEIEKLVEVFNKTDHDQSPHKRESALKPQVLALKQSIAAVATAESAAYHQKLDPTLANMCAGIRQLGVNLVAWNYPRIYSRAIEHCAGGKETLDHALSKILGYSPMELGSELALKWDKTGGLAAFVNNDREKLKNLSEEGRSQLGVNPDGLLKCIQLGETVSKLIAPEMYPETVTSMPTIITSIEAVFGKGGLAKVRKTLKESGLAYSGEGSDSLSLDIDPKAIGEVARAQVAAKLVQENSWVVKCPSLLQEKFKALYAYVDRQTVSPIAINILVGEVIPLLGFTRGCVYIVENNKMKLVPILRIGDAPITRYRALDWSAAESSSHPVIVAMGYSAPLIQENVPVNGEFVSHVTGVFEGEVKSGVLYLEMSDKLARSADRGDALLYFKAIRQALTDCLNIR